LENEWEYLEAGFLELDKVCGLILDRWILSFRHFSVLVDIKIDKSPLRRDGLQKNIFLSKEIEFLTQNPKQSDNDDSFVKLLNGFKLEHAKEIDELKRCFAEMKTEVRVLYFLLM
jgi:hypothetical protein